MLINEIALLEYDRQRAKQALGDGLWIAALREATSLWNYDRTHFQEYALRHSDTKAKYIRDTFADTEHQSRMAERVLNVIENADPTKNKEYTQWMARMYINGSEKQIEDVASTLATNVDKFNKLKIKRMLPASERDINRFRSAQDFYEAMELYEDPEAESGGKAQKVYEDSDVLVVVPEDRQAACSYGRRTRWCTAATKGNNAFEEYNRQGPLYILIPKTPRYDREKYQIHFESNQYMNEKDDTVSIAYLLDNRFPNLLEFFKRNETTAKYLEDMIVFAPDEVLEKLVNSIWELIQNKVNDALADWEANDDYYYQWLGNEGYMDEDGNIDWDRAPSYTDYNGDARRWMLDIEEFARPSIPKLKKIVNGMVEDGTFDEDNIYWLESFIAQNLRNEMRKDSVGADFIADWIDKNVTIKKTYAGPIVSLKKK
jgi:nuclear transport factor 2 (NTF2) superfamily protein